MKTTTTTFDRRPRTVIGSLTGATAMICVGSSAAVSQLLTSAPVLTAQAIRYALACLVLLGYMRLTGRKLVRPHGREWGWLLATAVTGMAVFNVALADGSLVAQSVAEAAGAAVSIHELDPDPIHRSIALIQRQQHPLSPTAQACRQLLLRWPHPTRTDRPTPFP